MAITRWDPFRDALALQNRMNSLFLEYNRTQGEGDALATAAFVPPVDVYEDEHKIGDATSAQLALHATQTTPMAQYIAPLAWASLASIFARSASIAKMPTIAAM